MQVFRDLFFVFNEIFFWSANQADGGKVFGNS